MKIYGIDFTSSPSRNKPITCLECTLGGRRLTAVTLLTWPGFDGFEALLRQPGPWLAGIDFPFGQARRFIDTVHWPPNWQDYVRHAASLGRQGYIDALKNYRATRESGDKEHRRATDICDSECVQEAPLTSLTGRTFSAWPIRLGKVDPCRVV